MTRRDKFKAARLRLALWIKRNSDGVVDQLNPRATERDRREWVNEPPLLPVARDIGRHYRIDIEAIRAGDCYNLLSLRSDVNFLRDIEAFRIPDERADGPEVVMPGIAPSRRPSRAIVDDDDWTEPRPRETPVRIDLEEILSEEQFLPKGEAPERKKKAKGRPPSASQPTPPPKPAPLVEHGARRMLVRRRKPNEVPGEGD